MTVDLVRTVKRLIIRNLHFIPPLKKWVIKRQYNKVAQATEGRTLAFMNYGYASLDPNEPSIEVFEEDLLHRFQIGLYYHLASQAELEGKKVLEVGSGQGGGSYFLKRYMHSRSVTGVDLATRNVINATAAYPMEGLSFCQGDAEALPLAPDRFDAVVNVESSHCYPRIAKFFSEVHRVLRPGGVFLYADLRPTNRVERLKTQLQESGLTLVRTKEITENVVEAIRQFDDGRKQQIRAIAGDNEEQYHIYTLWTRVVGTKGYQDFCDGKDQYWSFVLQKRT